MEFSPSTSDHPQPPNLDDRAAEPTALSPLMQRVALITRIQAVLRSTRDVEDIYSIVLTTLVCRTVLNFSRSMIFELDPAKGAIYGLAALGCRSQEDYDSFYHEIDGEDRRVAEMMDKMGQADFGQEEAALFGDSLRQLPEHSFWLQTYRKLSHDNPLLKAINKIKILCHPSPSPGQPPCVPTCRFIEDVIKHPEARIVTAGEVADSDLPPSLVDLLSGDSLWVGIRTHRGLRLILVVDRMFHPDPLIRLDCIHLDWFAAQVALALDNAELFKELQDAYDSQKELDHLKSNFLSTVSHELRTPLTAITGYSQLLLAGKLGPLDTQHKDIIERIGAHGAVLVGKVNDLIEIAELQSSQQEQVPLEAIDPLEVITDVTARIQVNKNKAGVSIQTIALPEPKRIRSNRESLDRIFFHLIDNAIKFIHTNGRVKISFETADDEMFIHVNDDGIGIPEKRRQRIFEAFYQVDNQLARSFDGLGLGLTIIKKQLGMTGGHIQVKSEPGQGSTFTVIYPVA